MCGFTLDVCHAKCVDLHWTPAMPNVWIYTRHLPCQICGFRLDVCHARCVDSHSMPAMPNVWIHTGCLPCQVCGFRLNACHARCVHSHAIYPMLSHTAFTAAIQNCAVRLFHKCRTTQISSTELRKW